MHWPIRSLVWTFAAVSLLSGGLGRLPAEDRLPAYPPAAEVKQSFLQLLDRPRVPLDARTIAARREGDLLVEEVSFATERRADGTLERVPALVVRPAPSDRRRACVIVLHGTGGNKESQRGFLNDLARRGLIGVAIDARYHGARTGGGPGREAYVAAITRAWRAKPGEPQEHPFYYDTVWDLWRTVDYLVARPDVDPARLGMIGFSMGGIQTWLAASVDDRIKAAVPAIAVQSFRWSLEQGQWQGRARTIQPTHDAAAADLGEPQVNERVCRALWNKLIPGMLDAYDCPSMLRLFADRDLLIVGGERDPNCPLGGAQLAIASAEQAFRAAGRAGRLKVDLAPGVAHAVTPQQRELALDWLQARLD